ncbi:TRAF-like family protein [Abeliophyllum distichum]|uniref:TRAF-like family protein n=1 Tax=Abeliophyllum distichum TaxID=126358 RepID=A0ABD1QFM2_9LAMI
MSSWLDIWKCRAEKPSVAVEDHSRDAGVAVSCVFASTTTSESVVVERRSDYSALCKWHRFSSKKKSHGWCDFASLNSLLDPKLGFLHSSNDCILVTADILILHESFSFSRDNYDLQSNNVSIVGGGGIMGQVGGDVLSGKFTWRVHNFSLFKEMIKAQKIMSPVFPAGECNLRISVYQSAVNGIEYLSMCLESKDTEKNALMSDKSC